jgi:hypothetical protein
VLIRQRPAAPGGRRRRADLRIYRRLFLAFFKKLVVVLVLALVVVDDPEDLDEAEGGPKPPQGRLLVGVGLGHGPAGYRRGGWSRRGPQV